MIKTTRSLLALAGFFLSIGYVQASDCIETRAGFDIGSGTTKAMVAEVDVCHGILGNVLYQGEQPVGYNADLARSLNGELSPAIANEGLATLQSLLHAVNQWHPTRISGVATEVFRSASNGEQVIADFERNTGLSIKVLSQEQEALLGFLSAKATLNQPALSNSDILVWDIGGGSMQMTSFEPINGHLRPVVYLGKLAAVSLKDMIIDVFQNKDLRAVTSPNPVGDQVPMILRFIRFYATTHVRPEIRLAAARKLVIGIGGVHSYSISGQLGTGRNSYRLEELKNIIGKKSLMDDSQLQGKYKATDVTNLLLVEGFMEALDIAEVHVVKASLIQGVLLQ
ncbi:Ppx/GppA phosphatase family protein [Lonsdalea quercina]|uniref:Exopolyphosphatase / guanosine-5'-triphosphate,3'-diphosphate pyrophosphatase n=1 Tax=Lonsdalea quercina TaxID=71657 RepID=A0A1H3ZKG8_9GAMM|nr:phosphatase [Lonsdalea quercina]SEA24160.1 exopolyphosphatase / guanosine-5'-triphosphate,3'-diphosphate pyrophosphatase [Lonsdalea quercina]